ncbi:phospholipase-like protein [Tanacetum coccineum]|uniref:Phospholipase-like protein n=1 Tax=Tanacetum coccineum TaxID=301880 RepID=A0ABQ5H2L9_9ASTR
MLGRQLEVEGDGNENVPLYYDITDKFQIQFERDEFCLVTGLRFGVENLGDYNGSKLPILFRRRAFPSCYDGEHITGHTILEIIEDEVFDRLHDEDAVSLCCLGILQLVLLGVEAKRRIPDWMLRLANDRVVSLQMKLIRKHIRSLDILGHSRNLPGARLTLDETEARSNWWISSRAYFDGGIGQTERLPRHLNRQNIYEVPSELYRQFEEQKRAIEEQKRVIEEIQKNEDDRKQMYEKVRTFMEGMNVEPGGPSSFQTHPNSSSVFNIGTPTNWQTPMSSQPGPSNWQSLMPEQSATPYWQPAFPSHPGGYNWQSPIPSHMGNQNLQPPIERHHNAVGLFNPANLSPLNLGNAFDDENEGGDDVIYLGGEFTGNYLVYENVDPQKVKREHYVTLQEFLNDPKQIYLDCYMKGYLVPVTFWQQLVPHLCMPDIDSRTPMGWLSGEHMNAWMELLIRYRSNNDPWTVAYTNTISVHPENQRFLIETDQHTIGTLDGSTRPYPAWSAVNWVFLPIHVGGNHWVTGVIDLPNAHVYVFDSLPNEGRRNLLWNQIQRWTPVVNNILQGRDRSAIVNGDPQEFWETIRNNMCKCFYLSRCEDTRDCGYD